MKYTYTVEFWRFRFRRSWYHIISSGHFFLWLFFDLNNGRHCLLQLARSNFRSDAFQFTTCLCLWHLNHQLVSNFFDLFFSIFDFQTHFIISPFAFRDFVLFISQLFFQRFNFSRISVLQIEKRMWKRSFCSVSFIEILAIEVLT